MRRIRNKLCRLVRITGVLIIELLVSKNSSDKYFHFTFILIYGKIETIN
jgi:hypothetical protein